MQVHFLINVQNIRKQWMVKLLKVIVSKIQKKGLLEYKFMTIENHWKQKTWYDDPLSLTIASECQCAPSPNEPRPSKNGFGFIGRVRLDILVPQNNWQQPDCGKMSSRTSFASQQRLRTCSQRANHKNCDNQSRRKKTNPRRLRCRRRFGFGKSSGRNSWRQHCFHKKCDRKNHWKSVQRHCSHMSSPLKLHNRPAPHCMIAKMYHWQLSIAHNRGTHRALGGKRIHRGSRCRKSHQAVALPNRHR